ncbi:fimbrial protein [Pseudocitrobacter faecalis]|uniref:fimbrial protein n=1 Tax=Pseudocitrobacter faecalis TaxID=1398493 RepID=UPI003BA1BE87
MNMPAIWAGIKPRAGGTISFIFLIYAVSPQAFANEVATYFYGTLLESPPCIINGGNNIVVDFGNELMTTRIDGQEYRQKIEFTLDCSVALSSKQKVRINGATVSAGFNSAVLKTEKNGLGIALYSGDSRYSPGTWITFTDPNLPVLYAVPEKQDGVALSGGTFSVLASLVVDYQ